MMLSLLFIVFWQWWLPGPRVAIDFPIVLDRELMSQIDLPRVWAQKDVEGLGEYSVFTLWSYPTTLISAILAKLGLGFAPSERVLWIIPFIILGTLGIWKLCKELNLSDYAKSIAGFFYVANTYILLVIDGGQFSIALAYALFPLSFLMLKNSIGSSLKKRILAGLSVFLIGIFDIRVIFILFILILIYFLYGAVFNPKQRTKWTMEWIKTGLVCALISVTLNAYWLLPYILNPIHNATFQKLTQTNFQTFANLGHGMFLIAPHWHENVFGNIAQLNVIFIIIPLLVFLAPILRPKDKTVGFWIIVSLVGVFLGKGADEPLGQIYKWLFLNLPGFSLFRDSTKFFFLIALSFSFLLAITTDEILKKMEKFYKAKLLFFIFILGYLLILIRPVWIGEMTGTFSKPPYEIEYSKLTTIFENDKQFSRIFWIPSKAPLGYFSLDHPSVEALRLVGERPFTVGTKGTYEILNFLREAPYMGEIFDVAGIGYIVYPSLDKRRDNLHPDNISYYHTFLGQLSNLPWLSKVDESPIPLLKVKKHQDRFFSTPNLWWIIGSDDLYEESTRSATLRLSKNAFIFAEEYDGLGRKIDELPEAQIVLNDKTIIDLAASFINPDKLLFPAEKLENDPDNSGWWKRETADLIRWRDFLRTKYDIDNQDFDLGGGWAVGEGNRNLKIENQKFGIGKILLARVMESIASGTLTFHQGNQLIGELKTKNKGDTNIRWFEVGDINQKGEIITISSSGPINVVNALAAVDKNKWLGYKNKADDLNKQGRIKEFSEKEIHIQEAQEANVSYIKMNPTKYLVTVSNLREPAFLIFSESYDPGWALEGRKSLPVYSLLNGFKIEKDGIYEVTFKPQRMVHPGLYISIATLFIILTFLLWNKRKGFS